jgi:hypothetical protein
MDNQESDKSDSNISTDTENPIYMINDMIHTIQISSKFIEGLYNETISSANKIKENISEVSEIINETNLDQAKIINIKKLTKDITDIINSISASIESSVTKIRNANSNMHNIIDKNLKINNQIKINSNDSSNVDDNESDDIIIIYQMEESTDSTKKINIILDMIIEMKNVIEIVIFELFKMHDYIQFINTSYETILLKKDKDTFIKICENICNINGTIIQIDMENEKEALNTKLMTVNDTIIQIDNEALNTKLMTVNAMMKNIKNIQPILDIKINNIKKKVLSNILPDTLPKSKSLSSMLDFIKKKNKKTEEKTETNETETNETETETNETKTNETETKTNETKTNENTKTDNYS